MKFLFICILTVFYCNLHGLEICDNLDVEIDYDCSGGDDFTIALLVSGADPFDRDDNPFQGYAVTTEFDDELIIEDCYFGSSTGPCTLEIDPSCGCNGVTYGNGCGAFRAGFDVASNGECTGDVEVLFIIEDLPVNTAFYIRIDCLYDGEPTGDYTEIEIFADNPCELKLGCMDETANNYDPEAEEDDGSCAYCCDGLENGTETDVDCGGEFCKPCTFNLDCASFSGVTIATSTIPYNLTIDELLQENGLCDISFSSTELVQELNIDCSYLGSQNIVQDSVWVYDLTISDSCLISYFISDANNSCNCTHGDYDALMKLYKNTNGENWSNNSDWIQGTNGSSCSPCSWFGVDCDGDRIIGLFLRNNNLIGNLPELSFQDLLTFDVSDNTISGSLPTLSGMNNLEKLYVFENELSGNLEPIQQLRNLEELWAFSNNFEGSIPDFNQANLSIISIGLNNLTGSIPQFLNLQLDSFFVNENNLEGEIPDFVHMSNLNLFYAYQNNLSGCFPSDRFCDLASINNIDFNDNPLLPYNGDYQQYCNDGGVDFGAPCGMNQDSIIDMSCNCSSRETFSIIAENVEIDLSTTNEVCVDFSVENFTNIAGMQYTIQWDSNILNYNSVETIDSEFSNSFNAIDNDKLRYVWTHSQGNGLTLLDQTIIYTVCFDVVETCIDNLGQGFSSSINFTEEIGRPIEVTDGTLNLIPDSSVNLINGNVAISCGIQCSETITNVRCFGEENGAVNLAITGGDPLYTVDWGVVPAQNNVEDNSLLVGLTAGSYQANITDSSGNAETCGPYIILEPDELVLLVDIVGTNSIDATAVGGTPNYEVSYSPDLVDVSDAPDGEYVVTVTDQNGCSDSENIIIGAPCDIEISNISVVAASCNVGGEIQVICTGGSGEYEISSEPQLNFDVDGMAIDVPAGQYLITCTDINNSACVVIEISTVLIVQPLPFELSQITVINETCNQSNGGFIFDLDGGCQPYVITVQQLTPVVGIEMDYVDNTLGVGAYLIRFTDGDNNILEEQIEITSNSIEDLQISNVSTRDALCVGMDGQATFMIQGGCDEINCEISINGGELEECNLIMDSQGKLTGDFPIGFHTITLTDVISGTNDSQTFTIETNPNALDVIVSNLTDSSIEITVSGGTPGYTYQWFFEGAVISINEDINGLTQEGTYTVIVQDLEGCSISQDVILENCPQIEWTNIPSDLTISCNDVSNINYTLPYSNSGDIDCIEMGTSQADTSIVNDGCDKIITLNWESTNNGIVLTAQQIIRITNIPDPMWVSPPSDNSIDCAEISAINDTLEYNNGESGICEIRGIVFADIDSNNNPCADSRTLIWTLPLSNCYNEIVHTQTIDVTDCTVFSINDDFFSAMSQEIIQYNLLDNDEFPLDQISISILDGLDDIVVDTMLTQDGIFSFRLEKSFFDTMKISYEVCDTVCNICESATLFVTDNIFEDIKPTNFLSPNGDGNNDELRFNNESIIENSELWIFNRSGGEVFYKRNYENSWKAEGHPAGIYFYVLKVRGAELKNTLTVLK